jgi:hypothetical protein
MRNTTDGKRFVRRVGSLLSALACVACARNEPENSAPARVSALAQAIDATRATSDGPVWKEFAAEARRNHAAVLLDPGRVLVCGGSPLVSAPHLSTCETISVDDTGDAIVAPFPSLLETRAGLTLTQLAPGRVLAFGGSSRTQSFYGASVGTDAGWSEPEANAVARADHTASLLDGTVVIVGGATSRGFLDTLGLRSESGDWSSSPFGPRAYHTATILKSGRELLVAGGVDDKGTLSSAFILSTDGSARAVRDLPGPRSNHTATLLPDGSVLVVGGAGALSLDSAYRYDVQRDEWLPAGNIPARAQHGAARLGSYVIIAGGQRYDAITRETLRLDDVYAFDASAPESAHWVELAPMHEKRYAFQLIALDERRLIASGGAEDATNPTSELFTPLALGESCSDGKSCVLGTCVEDICCNRPCTGLCESCTEPGTVGTCVPVSGDRGTCEGGNICLEGSCRESCSKESDCTEGYYCLDGKCAKKLANGARCTLGGACDSGICADGVCCEGACTGLCETCNQRGREGLCLAVPAGKQPGPGHGECDSSNHEACAASCDGTNVDDCAYAKAGTLCGEAACDGSSFSRATTCDGRGSCSTPDPRPCAPYLCDAGGCRNECVTDRDCTAGNRCDSSGRCIPLCTRHSDCGRERRCGPEGICVEGCDETACNGYRCDAETALCRTGCTRSETDCTGGYYCHPFRHECVEFVPFPNAELPGCATGPGPSRSALGLSAAAMLGLFWRARRRSRALTTRSDTR